MGKRIKHKHKKNRNGLKCITIFWASWHLLAREIKKENHQRDGKNAESIFYRAPQAMVKKGQRDRKKTPRPENDT
jgi:hypothetical protein